MTYNLFISHSWAYSNQYEGLVRLLNANLHTALPGGRWCGGERPECGVSGRSVKII